MNNRHRWLVIIAAMVGWAALMAALTGCSIGQPTPIPEPESQLTPKPGLFTGDDGEWVVYRKQ